MFIDVIHIETFPKSYIVFLSTARATASAATFYANNLVTKTIKILSFQTLVKWPMGRFLLKDSLIKSKLLWHKNKYFVYTFVSPGEKKKRRARKVRVSIYERHQSASFYFRWLYSSLPSAFHPCSGTLPPHRQKQHTIFLHNSRNIQRYHQSRVHVG